MNFIETLFVISSISAVTIMFKCCEKIADKIIHKFNTQKQEINSLREIIAILQEENNNFRNGNNFGINIKPFENNNNNDDYDIEKDQEEIIRNLIKKNEKLQIKCDMLEQELYKTREKYIGNANVEKSNDGYFHKY